MNDGADILIRRIRDLEVEHRGKGVPLLVALDGRSGSGKSTLSHTVGEAMGALVIDGDDFYSGGTDADWDTMSPAEIGSASCRERVSNCV
jgi:pantothenate kinase-related protein Tda10